MAATLLALIPAVAADRADAAGTKIIGRTFTLSQPNETPRLTVICPHNNARFRFPYGGGMYSSPSEPNGDGIYPHSYERLGVQGGYHVTPVLYTHSQGNPPARQVTLQVICGPEPGKLSPPHVTANVGPGEVKTLDARCAGKRSLIGGGFQLTDFTAKGGDFATESLAVAPNVWRVSGDSLGGFSGELTSIGYCRKTGGMSEVSASTVIQPHKFGSATTPPCTGGKSMTWTGFTTDPLGSILYAGGPFNSDNTVTGSGYNRSEAAATLTVKGYCNRVRPIF
jgi:hypothetical protein